MACLLGDAGHPVWPLARYLFHGDPPIDTRQMMPHQSQGACMAIEDAAALGILFNKANFQGDIEESLSVYNAVRLPRVTKVQAAAAKAAYNINERIGEQYHPHMSRVRDKELNDLFLSYFRILKQHRRVVVQSRG